MYRGDFGLLSLAGLQRRIDPTACTPDLLRVSEGDVFELSVWHSARAPLNVEADSQTWFAIEVVE